MQKPIRHTSNLGLSTVEEVDKLFNSMLRSFSMPSLSFNLPTVDIYSEDDNHMVVELPAPGFTKDQIEISVRDGVLEVRGSINEKEEHKDKKRSYVVRERTSSFARRIVLPEGAQPDDITAELDKGLLKITVPVTRPQAKRIEVKTKAS
jgi:HSP20 family protein